MVFCWWLLLRLLTHCSLLTTCGSFCDRVKLPDVLPSFYLSFGFISINFYILRIILARIYIFIYTLRIVVIIIIIICLWRRQTWTWVVRACVDKEWSIHFEKQYNIVLTRPRSFPCLFVSILQSFVMIQMGLAISRLRRHYCRYGRCEP